jgi:4-diphosphocytidyl-2-C-methyl-D-erythritol kinase
MIVFPNAKINLGLNIISKRPDHYHNIETVFYPIGWQDALEIMEASEYQFTSSGLTIAGAPENNLCTKAYQLMVAKHHISPVHIHLHKIIPMGAGLGGGSSDAAYTLKALNAIFNLQLNTLTLQSYASLLGADCAFFIENKPVLANGKGDEFSPIHVDLSAYTIVVIYPDVHVSTAEAYAGVQPSPAIINKEALEKLRFDLWQKELKNDFEDVVFSKHPIVGNIKKELYQKGALYASMSGSGAAVFGIFENEINLADYHSYQTWQGKLS